MICKNHDPKEELKQSLRHGLLLIKNIELLQALEMVSLVRQLFLILDIRTISIRKRISMKLLTACSMNAKSYSWIKEHTTYIELPTLARFSQIIKKVVLLTFIAKSLDYYLRLKHLRY